MAQGVTTRIPAPDRALSDRVGIVGVGETDYHDDYKLARTKPPGYELPTPESLAATAFDRALADAGLERGDIDGLTTSFIYGGPPAEELAGHLGIRPRWTRNLGGLLAGPIPQVAAAIAAGECDTVAMVYAAASRAIGRQYGGNATYAGESSAPTSYYYHHPWGWSSQAAHWAFVWTRYMAEYGLTEADLGRVAVRLRENARSRPQAVMQEPLTIESYLASRYIVRPLHLFDLCLVNDGAVCLILQRADRAKARPHPPALVAGWGERFATGDKLDRLVRGRLRDEMMDAGGQAWAMAGIGRGDVQHLEAYDASSMHLLMQTEGYGFAAPGRGLDLFGTGGRLPINTGGGMLSDSYMHGWNHVAEVVRQLRGGVEVSMFSLVQTDEVHPIIFRREA